MTKGQADDQSPLLIRRRKFDSRPGLDVTVAVKQAPVSLASELHKAKQEVAKELEANLKQLKQVMRETERIAQDMEAVLRQAKGPVETEDEKNRDRQEGREGTGGQSKQEQEQEHKQEQEQEQDNSTDPTLFWGPEQDEEDDEWDPLKND